MAFMSEYLPGGHFKHVSFSNFASEPFAVEKVPGVQGTHTVSSVAAAAEEYFPAAHRKQDDAEY